MLVSLLAIGVSVASPASRGQQASLEESDEQAVHDAMPALQRDGPAVILAGSTMAVGFKEFLARDTSATFGEVLRFEPRLEIQSFGDYQLYIRKAYEGTTPTKTIREGVLSFFCIPIRQQPSLRLGEPLDAAPSADEGSEGGVLGKPSLRCPTGTIPQRRVDLALLKNFRSFEDFQSKDRGLSRQLQGVGYEFQPPPRSPQANGASSDGYVHRYAVAHGEGAVAAYSASLNIWNPSARNGEMSLSQLWIVDESPMGLQTIEVGWQVSDWFEPNYAVPFVYWTRNGYRKTGCYDLECAGFVQTTNWIVFARLSDTEYSRLGGAQADLRVEIRQKSDTGNWWLRLNGIWVGYWPKSLYLAGKLSTPTPRVRLDAGGENTGVTPVSEMGSGKFPAEGYGRSAYVSNLRAEEAGGSVVPLVPRFSATKPECYSFSTQGPAPQGHRVGSWFYFGGPGTADAGCR